MAVKIWLPVVGYESTYEVSGIGDVRRITAWSDRKRNRTGHLRPYVTGNGYLRVGLFRDGRLCQFFVHRLVMAAFIGPRQEGFEVNHKNGNKTDNRLENLEYVTHSENVTHKFRVLKLHHFVGSESGTAKIIESDVIIIRRLRERGWKLKQIATRFGLSASTVCMICKNQIWTHV